jgi:hypothetical protein
MGRVTTDFLTSTPSFLTGMGSVANIAGNFYKFNAAKNGQEADARALKSDWAMVGRDISDAIKSQKVEPPCKTKS